MPSRLDKNVSYVQGERKKKKKNFFFLHLCRGCISHINIRAISASLNKEKKKSKTTKKKIKNSN